MSRSALRSAAATCIALMSLALAGCSATSPYMQESTTPIVLAPRAGAATVVFVRPSSFGAALRATILDGRGRFLGDSLPHSYFAITVPPGEHLFIGCAENTAALRATLAPGRTYYIEVSPRIGSVSPRVELLAVTPKSETYRDLGAWLAESTPLVADERAGQAYWAGRTEETTERVRLAGEAIGAYEEDDLAERTIVPDDGR